VSAEVFASFKNHLQGLEKQHFTTKELLESFGKFSGGYAYSPNYFTHLLTSKMEMYYYKPSPRDYRRPCDAETKLLERFSATLDALQVINKDVSQMSIGFADESAAQLHNNNARFWALAPHLPRPINSEFGTQKFFGFYALQGQSLLAEMQGCKGEDFKPLLLQIKAANPESKGIILFWDNAKAHKKVESWAWEQGIYIIPLPAYSPDLNPIERVWKSCKRQVNEEGLCKKITQLSECFQKAYDIYKVQVSFAEGWCEKMSSIFSWNNAKSQKTESQNFAHS
jgi:hypothetical protein